MMFRIGDYTIDISAITAIIQLIVFPILYWVIKMENRIARLEVAIDNMNQLIFKFINDRDGNNPES